MFVSVNSTANVRDATGANRAAVSGQLRANWPGAFADNSHEVQNNLIVLSYIGVHGVQEIPQSLTQNWHVLT